MDSSPSTEEEWERKQMIANAMLDFLEGWVIDEVCTGFRAFAEAVYSDTPEQRLLMVLLEDGRPLSLRQICSRCGVSRALMLPGGRLRRAMERLERRGIVSRSDGQAEEKPHSPEMMGMTRSLPLAVLTVRSSSPTRPRLGPSLPLRVLTRGLY